MARFKIAIICPCCGTTAVNDVCTTDYTTDDDVVCFTLFSRQHIRCDNCKADIFIDDVRNVVEYVGSEPTLKKKPISRCEK